MTSALTLRHQGQADVLAADKAAHRGYADLIPLAVDAMRGDFTAEDLRSWISEHYPTATEHHPNVLPAALGGMAAAGRITAVGHVQCTRTSRRAGWMRLWRPTSPVTTPHQLTHQRR